jgi:CRISPR-associated protein Cas1
MMATHTAPKHAPKTRMRAVMMSKRANVFYLERCKVMQKDERVVYLTETGQDVESMFNIPDKNTLFLLLGTGTSITNAAMRKLSESSVLVGFSGSGGSPLVATTDLTFVLPQDEYRPTEYMQRWTEIWLDEHRRLTAAKMLLRTRLEWTHAAWDAMDIAIPDATLDRFDKHIQTVDRTVDLLSAEAHWAKDLYATLARKYDIPFSRKEGQRSREDTAATINGLIDHGNYLAYGYSAVVLHTLGISYAMPVLHGKTRRGGLVFDVADLIKDRLVLPNAFEHVINARSNKTDNEFRAVIIDTVDKDRLIDKVFDLMKTICDEV